jgi:hypothetical protein
MNYELGGCMDSTGGNSSDQQRHIVRLNGNSTNATATSGVQAVAVAPTTDGTDILPTKDDEVKRWSCDMDSNILF